MKCLINDNAHFLNYSDYYYFTAKLKICFFLIFVTVKSLKSCKSVAFQSTNTLRFLCSVSVSKLQVCNVAIESNFYPRSIMKITAMGHFSENAVLSKSET